MKAAFILLSSTALVALLFPQQLTAPAVFICSKAGALLPLPPLLLSSLSHNLFAARSRRLTPLFIDLGTEGVEAWWEGGWGGGGRGDAAHGE